MRISTSQYNQTSVNSILDQQAKLSKLQEQVATGRRMLNPSDDPAGATRSLELGKAIATIEGYNRNADQAESRMSLEESALNEVGNVINRVRELAVQANNGSQSAEDRQKIGAEVRERLNQLVELANSGDGNGEYLFAGAKSRNKPFVTQSGEIAYQGDQSSRFTQVGPGRQAATTHSGFDVFMKIPNGTGEYVVDTGDNTGSGVVSTVEITDAASLGDPPYDIAFSENASTGELEYSLPDGTTKTFTEGEPITVNGLSVSIDGTPAAGDSFTIDRSNPQSLFETVDRFATALENATGGSKGNAEFLNIGNRTLQDLDQAQENVLTIRAELGARMSGLDSDRNANDAAVLELQTTKSGIDDLDYAKAITELNQRLTGLQAAQQSYSRIQGLSLFDYL